MLKNPELRRAMIVNRLDEHCKNGDAYLSMDELYQLCLAADPSLEEKVFREDLATLIQSKFYSEKGKESTPSRPGMAKTPPQTSWPGC